ALKSCGPPRPSARRTATSNSAVGSPLMAAARRAAPPIVAGNLSVAGEGAAAAAGTGVAGGSGIAARLGGRTEPVAVGSEDAEDTTRPLFWGAAAGSPGMSRPELGGENGTPPGNSVNWRLVGGGGRPRLAAGAPAGA